MKHNFRKLTIWEKAIDIVVDVYSVTKKLPKAELYGLTSQMRRAANAMSSNVAEGSAKSTNRDFRNYIDIALGSSNELISHLIVCIRLGYLDRKESEQLQIKIENWQHMAVKFQSNQLQDPKV